MAAGAGWGYLILNLFLVLAVADAMVGALAAMFTMCSNNWRTAGQSVLQVPMSVSRMCCVSTNAVDSYVSDCICLDSYLSMSHVLIQLDSLACMTFYVSSECPVQVCALSLVPGKGSSEYSRMRKYATAKMSIA